MQKELKKFEERKKTNTFERVKQLDPSFAVNISINPPTSKDTPINEPDANRDLMAAFPVSESSRYRKMLKPTGNSGDGEDSMSYLEDKRTKKIVDAGEDTGNPSLQENYDQFKYDKVKELLSKLLNKSKEKAKNMFSRNQSL